MIPRVSRGSSYQGANNYFLYDKSSHTKERVEWVHIHNIPTQNVDAAFKYMEHTAMHAEELKHHAGVAKTGRKVTQGTVYTFSLSWHPSQNPTEEHMRSTTLEALEALGLSDHEAVLVAHNDTPHKHVHAITSLINPQNGKVADISYDFLTLSQFAEMYEKEQGEILCPQRVENNERRRQEAKQDRQLALIKHREKRLDKSERIAELYHRSDSGKALQAALKEEGYVLAQGDRRGLVLVSEEDGKISSLSRQIKGVRAKDIRERLADVETKILPIAKDLSRELQGSQQQVRREEEKQQVTKKVAEEHQEYEKENNIIPAKTTLIRRAKRLVDNRELLPESDRFLNELDKKREEEQAADRKRYRLQQQQNDFYKRQNLLEQLEALKEQIQNASTFKGRVTGKLKTLLEQQSGLQKNLENMDQRMAEQTEALENDLTQNDQQHEQDTKEQQRQLRLATLKEKWQQKNEQVQQQTQSQDWNALNYCIEWGLFICSLW